MSIANATHDLIGHLTECYQVYDRTGRKIQNGDICLFWGVEDALHTILFEKNNSQKNTGTKEMFNSSAYIAISSKHKLEHNKSLSAGFGRRSMIHTKKFHGMVDTTIQCAAFFRDYKKKTIKFIFGASKSGSPIVRTIFDEDIDRIFTKKTFHSETKLMNIGFNCVIGDYKNMDDNWKSITNYNNVVEAWKKFSGKK